MARLGEYVLHPRMRVANDSEKRVRPPTDPMQDAEDQVNDGRSAQARRRRMRRLR